MDASVPVENQFTRTQVNGFAIRSASKVTSALGTRFYGRIIVGMSSTIIYRTDRRESRRTRRRRRCCGRRDGWADTIGRCHSSDRMTRLRRGVIGAV